MEKNRTEGSIFRTLLSFALPFLLSCFLQTLYGLADLYIIGRFCGVDSTAAVSVGSQLMHMLTVMITGLAMGPTVLIGRAVGAGRSAEASKIIGSTVTLFSVISLFLTALLLLLVRPIVRVMQTPAGAVPGTVSYLTVCFFGIPFITAYNVLSSVFRGLGDSKSPLYFIAAACVLNIALDCIFIGALGMGPSGAALGTTLAQTVSVLSALAFIAEKRALKLNIHNLRPSKPVIRGLLGLGVPVMLQDGFIQVSFLIITAIANRRGLTDAAAVGIVEKMIGLLFLIPSSMLASVSALCAQNIGAGRRDRARKTLIYAMLVSAGVGFVSALLLQFYAEPAVGLFLGGKEPGVIRSGAQYLRGYVWDCVLAGIHFCFSGYFCACGRAGLSFLHNFISIVCARVPLAYLASQSFPGTLTPMGLAVAAGSGLSVVVCIIAYLRLERRLRRVSEVNRKV